MEDQKNTYRPGYKFAVFDMDGTLIDNMYDLRTSSVQYLRSHGQDDLAEKLHDELLPVSVYHAMQKIQPLCEERGIPVIQREDVRAMVKEGYRAPKLRPGVADFLEHLKQCGVKMCLMSTTEKELILYAMQNAGLDQYFEFLYSTAGYPGGKRNPKTFEEVLERLGARADETAMFEDALYSIETAKSIGMYIVGIEDEIAAPNREKSKHCRMNIL